MTGVSFFIRDINCNKLSRITNKKTGEFKMTYVACTRLNIGKKMLKIPSTVWVQARDNEPYD